MHGDDLARDCSIKHFGYTSISDTLPLSLETYAFHALKKPHKLETKNFLTKLQMN